MKISFSQLDTFAACQQRWYLEKVIGVPQAPNVAFWLGTSFHKAVEEYGHMVIAGERGDINAHLTNALIGIGQQQLTIERTSHDPDHRYVTSQQYSTMMTQLHTMLTAFIERIAPSYSPIAVEQQFQFPVSTDIQCVGYIDAVTPYALVDFKTASAKGYARWQNEDLEQKQQATVYLLAHDHLTQLHPPAQPLKKMTFIVFGCDSMTPHHVNVAYFSTKRDTQDKHIWQINALHTAKHMLAIREHKVVPTHTPSILCRWCGVAGACEVGQAFVKQNHWQMEVPLVKAT